ncbi:MAG: hypothetical protein KAT04_09195 [Methylococcales bacterium]|nr:hypothetical protein [Methylococcales bacterium]
MDFTVAVIHQVNKLSDAMCFFDTVLGFDQQTPTEDGELVENGALAIRLVQTTDAQTVMQSLNLEMQTKDITETTVKLLTLPEIQLIEERVEISQHRVETRLQAPHNVIITLAQEFNEDDLGILLPLPTSLDWQQQAEDCIKQMLLQVPIGFRKAARTRVTERAEMLIAEQGLITVDIDSAVKALAQVTPIFQHQGLEIALKERGIDPGDFFQQEIPQ